MKEKLKSLDRNVATLVVIVLLVVAGIVYNASSSNDSGPQEETAAAQEQQGEENTEEAVEAEEGESSPEAEAQTPEVTPEDNAEADDDGSRYNYVAQAGDSYTKIVRKAIQTYGIDNDINLTPAQIIYAETIMTQAADEPQLNLGQAVSIDEETLKSTIDDASALDDANESEWEYYVQFVDFNTDAVGEAR